MAVAAYQLKSELARFCLPAPERVASRRLAWANSISLLFLIIGVAGEQSKLPKPRVVPPLEQPAPIIIEPLPPVTQPAVDQKESEQQNDDDKQVRPQVQAVTIDTPAINFAVPTPGSLLVPMAVAPTPPEVPMKRYAPVVVKHEPTAVQSTDKGGERPKPDRYPERAQMFGQQGTVTLLVTVNDAGKVVSAEIKESSGSPYLDEDAQRWVKNYWTVPPSEFNGGHVFLAPIRYELKPPGG
jgi:TonB family protein